MESQKRDLKIKKIVKKQFPELTKKKIKQYGALYYNSNLTVSDNLFKLTIITKDNEKFFYDDCNGWDKVEASSNVWQEDKNWLLKHFDLKIA